MMQLLESWYDKSTFAISTWRGDAQRYWLTQVFDCARNRHYRWLHSTPSQRASLEPAYILGDRKHIPEAQNAMESVLRTELLDVIPKSIADACMRHGYCTAELIVWYVMKQLILPHDINELTMQNEILTHPKFAPSTLYQCCAWLEEIQHRLNLCMKTGQQVHPRTIITFVHEVLNVITQYYRTVGNIWDSLYLKHQLRESNLTLQRVYAMLAEFLIELRLHDEQDKIAQIVTGSSSTVKHSMYEEYITGRKGKVPAKGKGKKGDGKVPSPSGDRHAKTIGSQAVAHKVTIVHGIIRGDSQADVQSVVLRSMSLHSVLAQSSLKPRMPSGMILLGPTKKMNGMTINGSQKSIKRPRVRKAKGKDLNRKASLRVRMHPDRLLHDLHSFHRRRMSDPNPNPNQKHAHA